MNAAQVAAWIDGADYVATTERDLQLGIEDRLDHLGHPEVNLSRRDRIDFLVDNVGIEVKVGGSTTDLALQLARYAEHPVIHELLVVTTRVKHHDLPGAIGGKPVHVLCLGGIL